MNMIPKILAPVVVVGLGIGVFALLHASKPEPEKKQEAPRALSVYVEEVRQADVALQVDSQGTVRPRTNIDIVSQVGGRITAVSPEFTEGGLVVPGISLISIDDRDYRLAVDQAEAIVAEAEVGVLTATADSNVARKQLRDELKASALALKKPQLAQARARLKAARANLELAKLSLERTRIALPFTGRIASTQVNVGQYVTPGTRLGKAFATDVVEVRLPLNDSQLASIGLPIGYIAGEKGGLGVELEAQVAGVSQHWRGHLVRLDAAIDSETRMLYGIVEVHDPYGTNVSDHGMPLAVGLYVNAMVVGRNINDAYMISRQALRAGNQVFVVDSDGKLEIREVEVTHSTDRDAVIANGLSIGDEVITSSIRNPIRGMSLQTLYRESGEPSAMARQDSPEVDLASELTGG